jgi:hypothetical protein
VGQHQPFGLKLRKDKKAKNRTKNLPRELIGDEEGRSPSVIVFRSGLERHRLGFLLTGTTADISAV